MAVLDFNAGGAAFGADPTDHPQAATRKWLVKSAAALAIAGLSVALSFSILSPPKKAPRHAHVAPVAAAPKFTESDAAAVGGNLSAADAAKINASIPFSSQPIRPATPFAIASAPDRDRATQCLTQAIYYEAGFEPREGQEAVAQVILNRVRHAAFPKTVCGVVFEGAGATSGCQFTFACDGSMTRAPAASAWQRARSVALAALAGHVQSAVGEATHYHAAYVAPYWGRQLTKITQIGAHIFYRWPGGWGEPTAFTQRYAGNEIPWRAPLSSTPAPTAVATVAEPPPEPHAPDDVGGRVVVGLGWTPAPPPPASDSLARVLASQGSSTANN